MTMGILRKLVDTLAPAAPQPAAPAAASPGSWLMLTPGTHTVDGVVVEIPASPRPAVEFAVTPGRHVVDGKVAIAPLIYESR